MIGLCTDLEIDPGGGGRRKNNLLDIYFFFASKKLEGDLKKMGKSVLWWVETGRWRWVGVKIFTG